MDVSGKVRVRSQVDLSQKEEVSDRRTNDDHSDYLTVMAEPLVFISVSVEGGESLRMAQAMLVDSFDSSPIGREEKVLCPAILKGATVSMLSSPRFRTGFGKRRVVLRSTEILLASNHVLRTVYALVKVASSTTLREIPSSTSSMGMLPSG